MNDLLNYQAALKKELLKIERIAFLVFRNIYPQNNPPKSFYEEARKYEQGIAGNIGCYKCWMAAIDLHEELTGSETKDLIDLMVEEGILAVAVY